MKLNLGCGSRKLDGYVNVDMYPECKPDELFNVETTPWPWQTSSVTAVVFSHSLEHMGASPAVFLAMIKELYRVSADGCLISIIVPHPRHDNYLNDPTHVRAITPELLTLFSKRKNREWQGLNAANTPLGIYLDVDFELIEATMMLDDPYRALFHEGKMTEAELKQIAREKNNVVHEYQIVLKAIKPAAA